MYGMLRCKVFRDTKVHEYKGYRDVGDLGIQRNQGCKGCKDIRVAKV